MYVIVGCIMLLSALDAINTLQLLTMGAVELNPLMNMLISKDSTLFIVIKLLITGSGLVILIKYQHFSLVGIKIKHISYALLVLYVILIAYQFSMINYLTI